MLHDNFKKAKMNFMKNMFAAKLIEERVKPYLDEKISKNAYTKENNNNDTYLKLAYVGEYSSIPQDCNKYLQDPADILILLNSLSLPF